MNLLIVRLAAAERWLLPHESGHHLEIMNVSVHLGGGNPHGLETPFSFCALPGRYFAELCVAAATVNSGGSAMILSPAFNLPSAALKPLIASLPPDEGGGAALPDVEILATNDNVSLAYRWSKEALCGLRDALEVVPEPPTVPVWQRLPVGLKLYHLRFLTATDAGLDARLLIAMGFRVRVARVANAINGPWPPGLPSFPSIVLASRLSAEAWLRAAESRRPRIWAYMPHHAGDILMTVDVLRTSPCGVSGIIVNAAYEAIVRRALPDIPVLSFKAPPPGRGRFSAENHPLNQEVRYLEQVVMPACPPDTAWTWLRPVRGYNDAETTVQAQLAFTLSRAIEIGHWPSTSPASRDKPTPLPVDVVRRPRRILLHIDGGWPLKVYPVSWQQELIRGLTDRGWAVSVLSDRKLSLPVPIHRFTDLDAFDALLDEHGVLIGSDSFPVHYASIHRRMPTICLFGPTSLRNLAVSRPHYRALHAGLTCSPCGARAVCPRFGGEACHNFSSPDDIIALLEGSA